MQREIQLSLSYLMSDHFSSCHPHECHVCQLWSQEDELHHVGLGDQLEDDGCWRSEFCGSANAPLNEDPTIPSTLVAKD